MIRTYQLYSRQHECYIQFSYTEQGSLCGFLLLTDAQKTEQELAALLSPALGLPLLQAACKKHHIELTELLPDLSFAAFWKKYNNTAGSKIKAEKAWQKLSESQRHAAIMYMPTYEKTLSTGIAKAYATTYLNGQYWEK